MWHTGSEVVRLIVYTRRLDDATAAGRDMTPGKQNGFGNFGTGFGFGATRMKEGRSVLHTIITILQDRYILVQ